MEQKLSIYESTKLRAEPCMAQCEILSSIVLRSVLHAVRHSAVQSVLHFALHSATRSALHDAAKMVPKLLNNGPKMVCEMETERLLEITGGGPGSAQAAFGILEASWRALGSVRSRKKVLSTRSWAL